MADKEAEKEVVDETTVAAPPADEEQTSDDSQAEAPKDDSQDEAKDEEAEASTEEAKTEESKSEEKPKESPRLQKRVQDLSRKLRQERQRAPQVPQTPQRQGIPEGDYTPEQLQGMVDQRADTLSDLKTQQQIGEMRSELERERLVNGLVASVNSAASEYDELNPKSPKYKPHLDKAIAEDVEESFVANPYIDVDAKIRRMVTMAREEAKSYAKETGEKVSEQASNAAVRSNTSSNKTDKKFADKSIAEMEAELGYAKQ